MAGAIAHRFNNSMMSVQGYLELLQLNQVPGSEQEEMVAQALKSAQGASQVGSMMLTYVGQRPLQLRTDDLTDIVNEVLSDMQSQLQPPISLKVVSSPVALFCKVDHQQVKEVVSAVLTNALESLDTSKGAIEVSLGAQYYETKSFPASFMIDGQKNGFYVYCRISDTGHGIGLEDLQRIFEPFYSTRFIGRGLGLALASGIIRMHKGAFIVKSVPGAGTVVTILLPSLTDREKEKRPGKDAAVGKVKFSGAVLLADDDDMVLKVGKMILEHYGFTVHTAVDGRDAVNKVRRLGKELRAVVLDVSMPEMGGIEAMGQIRKIHAELPVLLSSGYAETDLPLGTDRGNRAKLFLEKPFQMTDMVKAMEKLLGEKGLG